MTSNVISHGDFDLEYSYLQKAEIETFPPLICFHGFGRHFSDFEIFKPICKEGQSLISFHIFQHGKSKVADHRIWKQPIYKNEIRELFEEVCRELGFSECNLLGYSMGGKLCLILTEFFPDKVKALYLIAPDGITISPMYKFASRTKLGVMLFRGIIKNPKWFFSLSLFAKNTKIISKSTYRVMMVNLETREKRNQVGVTWYFFSRLDPDIDKIQDNINSNDIETVLIYGAYDKVIPLKQGIQFNEGLKNNSLYIVQQGHALMNKTVVTKLQSIIKKEADTSADLPLNT